MLISSRLIARLICVITLLVLAGCGGRDDSEAPNPNAIPTPNPNPNPPVDSISPAPISSLSANPLSSGSIRLSWTATGDDGDTGTASSYDVRYSTSPITSGNWSSAVLLSNEPLPQTSGVQEELEVTGLTASTEYYFAVDVTDEAGNASGISNITSATTNANQAGAGTVPGVITTPNPTLENLSIEWEIDGDQDEDGVVSVIYREVGTNNWQAGMDLIRVPAGSSSNFGFTWENKHSGSLFNLRPNTEYEIELTLNDPDSGEVVRSVNARTRPVPVAAANANVLIVNPGSFQDVLSNANPGDVLLLSPGTYSGFGVMQNGSLAQPIVIRGEDPASVIVNGNINLSGRRHVYLERLTVNGSITLNNGLGIVVRESFINTSGSGIVAQSGGVEDAYIVDNTILGSTVWNNSTVGAQGANRGEGIQLTGPGNVIAYNYVAGFRDAISTMEGPQAVNQYSIDIHNNDINIGADDAVEADYAMGNVRVYNNRISNSFVALSSQPNLGGPTYYLRNAMYNIISTPFKLHNGSVGDIAYHNTVVKCGDAFGVYTTAPWSRAVFRNNIFIGGEGGGVYGGYSNGNGAVANLIAASADSTFDYDAYGSIGTNRFDGRIGASRFNGLGDMRAVTTEIHAQQVDLGIFANVVTFPVNPFPEKAIPDLRLQSVGNVVDFGVLIPGMNDVYNGNAPDIGAYEYGDTLPQYGPRS